MRTSAERKALWCDFGGVLTPPVSVTVASFCKRVGAAPELLITAMTAIAKRYGEPLGRAARACQGHAGAEGRDDDADPRSNDSITRPKASPGLSAHPDNAPVAALGSGPSLFRSSNVLCAGYNPVIRPVGHPQHEASKALDMTLPRAFLFSTLTLSVAGTPACEGSTRQSTSAFSPAGDAAIADGAAATRAGGGTSSNGGAASEAGGSSGTAESGGDAGSGGSGPFVPPQCANPNQQLPPDAPALTPGVWTPINGQIPFRKTPAVVTQGMAIDPCNAATLYVCVGENPLTGNGGLWRSINAGTSWTKIGPMDGPNNVRVDPENPLHLYATDGVNGKTRGFWFTTDGGKTWTLPDGFQTVSDAVHNNDDVYRVEPDPADFNHLLLSFHSYWNNGDTAGVFESFDGGQKFTAIPVPDVHGGAGYDVFFLFNPILGMGDNKTWLYATQTVGYYRTIDAGKTWKKVSDTSMAHGGGQLYYTKDKVIYMGGRPQSSEEHRQWRQLDASRA